MIPQRPDPTSPPTGPGLSVARRCWSTKHLFSEAEFRRQFELAVQESLRDLREVHYRLLAKLGQSVPDFDDLASRAQLRLSLKQMIEGIARDAQWHAVETFGKKLVAKVLTKVGLIVLTRVGVSVGLLSAGATNAWWSAGAGLIIGLGIDDAWTTLRNPVAGFERDVTSWLDHLSADASASISAVLKDAVEERLTVWERAIEGVRAREPRR